MTEGDTGENTGGDTGEADQPTAKTAPPRWALAVYGTVIVGLVLVLGLLAYRAPPPLEAPAETVVLVTLDGLRPFELLNGLDPHQVANPKAAKVMPYFMSELVPQGVFIGDPNAGSKMRMGAPAGISMSGYQAIFGGRFNLCVTNQCAPLVGGSLLSDMDEHFPTKPIFLSSYAELCQGVRAAAFAEPAICQRHALLELARPLGSKLTQHPDGLVIDIGLSMLAQTDAPLVYLGLGESDTAGHAGNYHHYIWVLNRYDGFLRRIWEEVSRRNEAGRPTTLIVTVDHGRGRGDDWTSHRWNIPGTGEVWAFAAGHGIAAQGRVSSERRSLYDIRPTVGYLLGLTPKRSIWGEVISEILLP